MTIVVSNYSPKILKQSNFCPKFIVLFSYETLHIKNSKVLISKMIVFQIPA